MTRVHLLAPMKRVVLTEFGTPNSSSAAVMYAERVTSSLTPPCERKSIIKDPSHLQHFNLSSSNRHFQSVKSRTTRLRSRFPLHKWLWSITSPCNHLLIPLNAVTASHLIYIFNHFTWPLHTVKILTFLFSNCFCSLLNVILSITLSCVLRKVIVQCYADDIRTSKKMS